MNKKFGGGVQSPLGSLPGGNSPKPLSVGKSIATAKVRMPRIPIGGTMRNIDQTIKGAKTKLGVIKKAMGGKVKRKHFDEGGKVSLGTRAISTIKDAISHLTNKDASSAAATLRANREAMSHPTVAAAANSLRSSTNMSAAQKALTGLVNDDTDRNVLSPMGN